MDDSGATDLLLAGRVGEPEHGGSVAALPMVGDRVRVRPAHIDPTIAYHERMHVIDGGGEVVDTWSVDLRGW